MHTLTSLQPSSPSDPLPPPPERRRPCSPLPVARHAQSSAGQNTDNGGALMEDGLRANAGGVECCVQRGTGSPRHTFRPPRCTPRTTGGARQAGGSQRNPRSDMDKIKETTLSETCPQVRRGAWRCVAAAPCHVLGPHVFARPSCVHRVPRPAPAAPCLHGYALGEGKAQARRGSPVLPLRPPRPSQRLPHLCTQRC